MTIKLPGYKPIVPNKVWGKDAKYAGLELKAKDIIILKRYQLPTEKGLESYVQAKIRKALSAADDVRGVMLSQILGKGGIEIALALTPKDILKTIADDEGIAKQVISETIAEISDGNTYFLDVKTGIVPAFPVPSELKSSRLYEAYIMNRSSGKNGVMGRKHIITLSSDSWQLPKKKDVDNLVRHGTSRSRTLKTFDEKYDQKEVQGIIDTIYSGLPTSRQVMELTDVSDIATEEIAIKAITSVVEKVQMDKMEDDAVTRIANLISGVGGRRVINLKDILG